MISDIRYLLFDLDGTLTDSKHGILRSIIYALQKLGRVPNEADNLDWCLGPPLVGTFATLLETDDPALIDRAISLYRERYTTIGLWENAVYPGVPEMLATLKQQGYHLFVATSKPIAYAADILRHFELMEYFDQAYGSELNGELANKGDLIRHILAQEALRPEQALMTGDRRHDIEGAKLNGLRTVGVTYGYGSVEELTLAGADHFVAEPAAMVALLDTLATY